MNVGVEGVIFIWTAFLWPIIVTTFILVILNYNIAHRVRYWFLSVILGYIFAILVSQYVTNWLYPIADLPFEKMSKEQISIIEVNSNMHMILYFIVPLLVSMILLRWFWDKSE
ncbi:MAG: hypothetical protein R8G33_02560 [Gammaproteobacteria bacterium]|nr:hypothetical protein [Gammaproteobacteria bacterium]